MEKRRSRPFVYGVVLGVVLLLAMVGMWQASLTTAFAEAAGGDVPPGGTIPVPNPPGGFLGSVNVVHWAPFDADPNATAVDVRTEAGDLVNSAFSGLKYQDSSKYVTLPSQPVVDEYDWKVTLASDSSQVVYDIPPFNLKIGAVYTIILLLDQNQVTSLLIQHVPGSDPTFVYWPLIAYQ